MFKLLTEEERQKVAREYAIHRAIIMLLALILVTMVGIIGLLPSYVLSDARQNEVLERARTAGSFVEQEDEPNLQAWLRETNRKLQALSPTLDTDRPSDFIEKVLAQRVAGVRLTGFSWVKTADKTTLSVEGVATSRQSLIAFENHINSSGHFSEVILPISNLAKDRDINFQIKFSP